MQIDEEGFPLFSGLRVQDKQFGKNILAGIQKLPERMIFVSVMDGEKYIVEAFDQPYVVQMVYKNSDADWEIELPYDIRHKLILQNLKVDEWDRFHGRTENNVPFVFSRKAQNEFFNLVTEFNDDGFFIDDTFFEVQPYWKDHDELHDDAFWTEKYEDKNAVLGWDLGIENPILRDTIPQLKLPKSRILVLGCGKGHDARHLSELGHIVTAIDYSPEAIEQAKALYSEGPNLKFQCEDIFDLPERFRNNFDVVFDHTLFCAIDPTQRNSLIKIYRQCLIPQGHLLAIFFTIDHDQHPPFGGTEWEYRERLKKSFQFLYWTRWHSPKPDEAKRSMGSELLVYGKLKGD